MAEKTYDVAIIGAGIFGPPLAKVLAEDGRSVVLIERDMNEPDRIVGELLQPGGVAALEKLGLRECLEGIDAIAVHGYEIFWRGERVHIPYPYKDADSGLEKHEGRSFHHGRFIMKLREAARKTKGVTMLEATAKDLIRDAETQQVLGVVARPKGSTEDQHILASLTVCCDGSASNFRKKAITKKPFATSRFVGLKLIDAKMPRPFHGHVCLGDKPPVLLYQIGTHETRALVDVRGEIPKDMKAYMREQVLPELPKDLHPSFAKAIDDADRFPSMPNNFLEPTKNTTPGLAMLGDAMNMRHPLTGGGMTVAFTDVVLLKRLLSKEAVPDLSDTKAVLKQMSKFHWERKQTGSSTINILSMALYSLFAADDRLLKILQKGCFHYFLRGGNCVDGPVSLLACILPSPLVLCYHFFAVAFYSIFVMFRDMPVVAWPAAIVISFQVIWKACEVIMPFIFSEFRS